MTHRYTGRIHRELPGSMLFTLRRCASLTPRVHVARSLLIECIVVPEDMTCYIVKRLVPVDLFRFVSFHFVSFRFISVSYRSYSVILFSVLFCYFFLVHYK